MSTHSNQENLPFFEMTDPEMDKQIRRDMKEKLALMNQNKQEKVQLCSGCFLKASNFKKCGRCKGAWYCSRECQKADWSKHKEDCYDFEGSGSKLSHLVCKFAEHSVFWLHLQIYIILKLDLLNAPLPTNELAFEAFAPVGIEPTEIMTFHEIFSRNSNKSYDDKKVEGMFQINDIDVFRGYDSGRPAYDAIWERARREAVENGHSADPIGFIGFMNQECPEGSVMPIRISSQAREYAKLAPPFEIRKAMIGTYTKPFNADGCLEWINLFIRDDTRNLLHLRRKMTKADIQLIRDAGNNSNMEFAKRVRVKVQREDVYQLHRIPIDTAMRFFSDTAS